MVLSSIEYVEFSAKMLLVLNTFLRVGYSGVGTGGMTRTIEVVFCDLANAIKSFVRDLRTIPFIKIIGNYNFRLKK